MRLARRCKCRLPCCKEMGVAHVPTDAKQFRSTTTKKADPANAAARFCISLIGCVKAWQGVQTQGVRRLDRVCEGLARRAKA